MANTNATKSRMFLIATGLFIVTMSTVLFLVKENKLDINHDEAQAFVLQYEDIEANKSEEFYRNLLKNENDDLLILDKNTTIEIVSSELAKALGYINKDLWDQNFFSIIHPDDLAEVSNRFIEDYSGTFGPIRILTSSESYLPYLISMNPIKDEEGETLSTALVLKNTSQAIGEVYTNPQENNETIVENEEIVVEEQAPVVEEQAPVVEEQAPVVEEQDPVVEEQAPVVEEQAPVVEEQAPVVEEQAPVVEEQAPVVEEQAPVVEEQAPVVEEQAPVVEEQDPVVEEQDPVVEEQDPVVEEQAPVVEEQAPVVEEQAPIVEEQANTNHASNIQLAKDIRETKNTIKDKQKPIKEIRPTKNNTPTTTTKPVKDVRPTKNTTSKK